MTTSRDHDRVLEQWLKQSGGARSTPTPDCLDAETAASWADGYLDGAALAEAQLHVADCARCQALMATLLRTTPAQVKAALRTRRRWVAWTVPLAAAAVVVLAAYVWVNTPPSGDEFKQEADQVITGPLPSPGNAAASSAPQNSPTVRGRRADAAKAQSESTATDKTAGAPRDRAKSPASETPDTSAAAPDRLSKSQGSPGPSSDRKDSPQVSANQNFQGAPQPAAPPQAAIGEPSAGASSSPRDAAAPQLEARREVSSSADRLPTRPAPAPGATIEVVSPNRAVQWRITGDLVERTTDGGYTWSTAGALGSITSGSAPSAEVCWLAGRAGLVVRTTDGMNWSRVPFPEKVDLVAVGAVNAQTATVTAADGRVFATANGGQYWVADR